MGFRIGFLLRRLLLLVLALGAGGLLTGCASFYLDPATQDVPAADMPHVATLRPVRLNFEFQTRGAPNAAATAQVAPAVREQLQASRVFSTLDGGLTAGILEIKLNNIPLNDDSPAAKGFVTGFTFGLVGTSVSDGYVCTLSYLPPGAKTPIVKTSRHAIHATLGNASPPPGTIKTESAKDAVMRMTHAVVSNALRDLVRDQAFNEVQVDH